MSNRVSISKSRKLAAPQIEPSSRKSLDPRIIEQIAEGGQVRKAAEAAMRF